MGFLDAGTPLSWKKAQRVLNYVKRHGVLQLLHLYNLNKDRKDTSLKWGEEIEFTVVQCDKTADGSTVRLLNNAHTLIEQLDKNEEQLKKQGGAEVVLSEWRPEYSQNMVEAIPAPPYDLRLEDVLKVEKSMRVRREKINGVLGPSQKAVALSAFPRMGVSDFSIPYSPPDPDRSFSKSVFLENSFTNPHPRFGTLTANIRERRGAKVAILIPLFKDERTGTGPQWELAVPEESLDRRQLEEMSRKTPNPVKDKIYMDAMGFGMGLCCEQVTFLAPDIRSARHLYDQLAVLAPLWLALTASTPFLRGLVADTDTRWEIISASVDCRTACEAGEHVLCSELREHEKEAEAMALERATTADVDLLDVSGQHADAMTEEGGGGKPSGSDSPTASSSAESVPTSPPLASRGVSATCCAPEETLEGEGGEPSGVMRGGGSKGQHLIHKSRYAGISLYISEEDLLRKNESKYNDVPLPFDDWTLSTLLESKMDPILAKHFGWLFVRDPLVIFSEAVKLDDRTSSAHFENIQSTNWNSVRFKPPPPAEDGVTPPEVGWRVEFRTPDVQLTDFENAATAGLITAIVMMLLKDMTTAREAGGPLPDLYIPISKLDDNMTRASKRNALLSEKFWFRKKWLSSPVEGSGEGAAGPSSSSSSSASSAGGRPRDDAEVEMTIDEILFGSEQHGNEGVISRAIAFAEEEHREGRCSAEALEELRRFAAFTKDRCAGRLMTTASYLRKFLREHPTYQKDSVVTPEACHGIVELSCKIANGELKAPELIGNYLMK